MISKKKLFFIFTFVLPIFNVITIIYKNLFNNWLNLTIVLFSITLFVLSLFFYKKKLFTHCKFALFLQIILFLIVLMFSILKYYNLITIFSSIASFRDFIISTGSYGMLVYVIIQILQVMFLPIPTMIINLAGVAIYGPIVGAMLCTTGILIGSYLSFMVGKILGKKVAIWLVGENVVNKYAKQLNEKGRFFLFIAFLLPLFPDDTLCIIAGITDMKFKTFFIISTITRPIGVIFMSFFGGGYIIPFKGWGLYVWPVLLVIIIIAVIYVYKHQSELEEKVLKLIKKNQ